MNNEEKDTREKIIEVALRLFSEKSYKIVSLAMIAKEVNIQKPSIYYYFRSKEDLFIESLKSITDEFYILLKDITEKEISTRKKVEEVFKLYTKYINKKKNILRIFRGILPDKNVKILKFIREFKDSVDIQLQKIMNEVIDLRHDKARLDPCILAKIFFGMMEILVHKKYFCTEDSDKEDQILTHINILLFNI